MPLTSRTRRPWHPAMKGAALSSIPVLFRTSVWSGEAGMLIGSRNSKSEERRAGKDDKLRVWQPTQHIFDKFSLCHPEATHFASATNLTYELDQSTPGHDTQLRVSDQADALKPVTLTKVCRQLPKGFICHRHRCRVRYCST